VTSESIAKRFTTSDKDHLLEMLVHVRALAPHDVRKVRSEDKRCTLSLDTEFLFEISQEVTKVNVEQVASSCDLIK
jgi:hypothetical protein